MMESSFTGMKYVTKDDTNVHERIMEQYIEERLGNVKEKAPEGMYRNLTSYVMERMIRVQ